MRDLRLRWPAAEALLQEEKEIVITRDAKPVAKLVRIDASSPPRKRLRTSRGFPPSARSTPSASGRFQAHSSRRRNGKTAAQVASTAERSTDFTSPRWKSSTSAA
ncbi:MAG: hypothetical protein FJZ38_05085 [Candidatus Rokubacteria bacterium]|nr:hypothetical protein [Candidatus Rokubacteria bacterium]